MAYSLSSPPLKSLTPESLTQLKECSEKVFFQIISTNLKRKSYQISEELSIFLHAVDLLHGDEQGLCGIFVISSATSGKAPKVVVEYRRTFWSAAGSQNIIITPVSDGLLRMQMGWNLEQEEDRMSSEVLWTRSITPELEYIEHVQNCLKRHLCANPARAAELRTVGPPSNITTTEWVKSVWPNLKSALSARSSSFSWAVPKIKHVLAPHVILQTPGYGSSECKLAVMNQRGDLNRFKILLDDAFIEYLDVDAEDVSNKLCVRFARRKTSKQLRASPTMGTSLHLRSSDLLDVLSSANEIFGAPMMTWCPRYAWSSQAHSLK
ncbi:hypothetical protein F4604DRAFT_1679584 [Suillus subluteus]|nr:hypothetical protein F4604DRAFT_1679584 [Suillus subluteus]